MKFQYHRCKIVIIFIIAMTGILCGSDIIDMEKVNQRFYTNYLDSTFVGKSDDETIQLFYKYTGDLTAREYLTLMYEIAETNRIESAGRALITQLNKMYDNSLIDPFILLELISNQTLNADYRYLLIDFIRSICNEHRSMAEQIANTMLSIATNNNEVERIRLISISVLNNKIISNILKKDLESQELLVDLAVDPDSPSRLSARAIKFIDSINPNKLDSYSINVLNNYSEYSESEIKNAIVHFKFREELLQYLDVVQNLGDTTTDKSIRLFCVITLSDVGTIESVKRLLMMNKSGVSPEIVRSELLLNIDIVKLMINEKQNDDIIEYGLEAIKIMRIVESIEWLRLLQQNSKDKHIIDMCEVAINELNKGQLEFYNTIVNPWILERRRNK